MATNIHAEASKQEPVQRVADDDAFDFFSALVRCETRLYNGVNDALRERHGIVGSQYEFLRFVRAHPNPRVADVARAFAVGLGATSKGIDRLETRGLVRRVANPEDGRSSILELTESGMVLLRAAEQTFTVWLTELLQGVVSPEEIVVATGAMQRLQQHLEHQRIGTPTG